MKQLFLKIKHFKMKKEHIAPIVATIVVIGVLVFSWQYYQSTQKSTAAAPAAPAAKTT